MKRITLFAVVVFLGLGSFRASAASAAAAPKDKTAAKDKTVTGTGVCAKCALKEAATCQTAIQVKKGNRTVTYYLEPNDVAKEFHKNICKENKPVKATLKVAGEKGKKVYTASKIELAKSE